MFLKVIETNVGFSDTCGNGLIHLSFFPKSKSFSDCGFLQFSSPSLLSEVHDFLSTCFAKEIVASMHVPTAHIDFAIAKSCMCAAHIISYILEDYIANSLQGGGVMLCPSENLPVFKLQKLECLTIPQKIPVFFHNPKKSQHLSYQ